MSRDTIRLVVADDHVMVRQGLIQLLRAMECFVIQAEAGDGDGAVEAALRLKPDVVLMDLSMPGMNGIEATRAIKKAAPEVAILILTAHGDDHLVSLAVDAGADGFMLKTADRGALCAAITALVGEHGPLATPATPAKARKADFSRLTCREREIMRLVASGFKSREISEKLHISVKTVEKHRSNIKSKLGMGSVAELVSLAVKTGFLLEEKGESD